MKDSSLWHESASLPRFERLKGDMKTDVLIIGAGIAGLLCAYFLHRSGVPYILVEGGRIGGGISGDTTAKITSQHGLIYGGLIKTEGYEKAQAYLSANQRAVEEFYRLAGDISCDFESKDAYVYSLFDREAVERETKAVNRLGFKAEFRESVPLPFDTAGAVKFPAQAQFHPLKFICEIAKGLNIFEDTFVRELRPGRALTDTGTVRAGQIIVATHFPFLNKIGGYFLKLYQHRSYAVAVENAAFIDGMYLEEGDNGLSFRNYKDLLIIGGGDHKTGNKGGNWRVLRDFYGLHYPSSKERHAWAAQDCMSLDGIPYIGRYSKSSKDLYVATGFNKWGMSSSMAAAKILTDMVMGVENEYAGIFSPQRSMLKPRFFVNGASAVVNLLSIGGKRCPHMGCKLRWNSAQRSWDCPCHGSRFDEDGGLIDNPATRDMS